MPKQIVCAIGHINDMIATYMRAVGVGEVIEEGKGATSCPRKWYEG
jgi:hypothetical protein